MSTIPYASYSMEATARAKSAYDKAKARLDAARNQRAMEAGYTYGHGGKLSVDPNKPYGELQMMLRGQAKEDVANREALLARGITGGLANQQRSEDRYMHGYQSAVFGSKLAKDLAGYADQLADAKQQFTDAKWMAERDAARQAINDQNFTPANFTQLSYTPTPDLMPGDTTDYGQPSLFTQATGVTGTTQHPLDSPTQQPPTGMGVQQSKTNLGYGTTQPWTAGF